MLTEQAARELKDSTVGFHAADANLRAVAGGTGIIEAAEEYVEARDRHQEVIEKVENQIQEVE